MSAIAAEYVAAILAVRPDLAGQPMTIHTHSWDSDAVEAGDTMFKFPKRDEAVPRLRREARFLALIHPRVRLAVPKMILHEEPRLFSEHRTIPGTRLDAEYETLSEAQREAMSAALARFYADLHAIPIAEAIAAGAEDKPDWPTFEVVHPILARRLPLDMKDYVERSFAAYAALPAEDTVFGYFDGHGWNMAFDHGRGVLNGVYDFADAALGPRSREFTYSNLTSGDLTLRIVSAYNELTGHRIEPRTVAIRTAVQTLSELAEAADDGTLGLFVGGAMRWHGFMQAHPALRI